MAKTVDQLIYGPEWTFTNLMVLNNAMTRDVYLGLFWKEIRYRCQTSKKCKTNEALKTVEFSGGFKVYITNDPGVVEVRADPISFTEWKSRQQDIEFFIFDTMKKASLTPHDIEGAGHLNIGLEYFRDKPLLLRNFIVDFYNNPGVGVVLNALKANEKDAPYFDQVENSKDSRDLEIEENFRQGLSDLDSMKKYSSIDVLKKIGFQIVYKYLAMRLQESGYDFDAFQERINGTIDEMNINSRTRLENRALRPQKSMQDFIKVLEIFESRISYLEKRVSKPIPLLPTKPILDGRVALGQFADYLSQAKLDWSNFKSLMPEVWRNLQTSDFVLGTTRINHSNSCNKVQN